MVLGLWVHAEYAQRPAETADDDSLSTKLAAVLATGADLSWSWYCYCQSVSGAAKRVAGDRFNLHLATSSSWMWTWGRGM